jgi:hypothetical protein
VDFPPNRGAHGGAYDGGVQAAFEIDKRVFAPDAGAQLIAADDIAGMLQQLE